VRHIDSRRWNMNTVRETDRPRCTGSRSKEYTEAERRLTLEAQGRAVRIAGLVLFLAFAVALFGVDRSTSRGIAAGVSPVAESEPEVVLAEFPITVNERVEGWMDRYLNDQRPQFEHFLSRKGLYSGMIRGKLRERGMPEDLLYLAMIESGFSPRATSRVSASGIWQFMGPTAQDYGLRIDEWVDERRDPIKATDAALDYLEQLHGRFGSWYLAAAAYNAGPSRVARLVRRHHGDRWGDEGVYWEILDQLPRETREYVPKLIAATLLASEAESYGFDVETATPYSFDQVFVPGGTRLPGVARSIGVEPSLLRDLNPHLIRGVTPPGISYPVRVPSGTAGDVVASLNGRTGVRRTD
jgi:membrane-bound lytic murein transglycosylase D